MATKNIRLKNNAGDYLRPETSADIVLETDTKKIMTSAERSKLNGIESNAEVNIIETIKVNGSALTPDGSRAVNITINDANKIPLSQKGQANGVASLDGSGKVPSAQLPSYVDDVLEYANVSAFPETGEDGKIYVAEDTNITYRWSGTVYVEISKSLALGETSSTAYAGNKGAQNARDIASLEFAVEGLQIGVVKTTGDQQIQGNKTFTETITCERDVDIEGDFITSDTSGRSITVDPISVRVRSTDQSGKNTSYSLGQITVGGNVMNLPTKAGTFALTSDIPNITYEEIE